MVTRTSRKKTVKKSSSKKKAAPKKKSVKKSSAAKKKSSSKKKARPMSMRNAHPDQVFVLVNGKRLKNVKELADVMSDIEDYVFHHHVREDNNDFANWLEHVFKDIDLAKQVSECKNKKHVQLVIYRHISHKLW